MLEKLVQSRTKINIIAFFLSSPERSFFAGELQKRLGSKNISSELASLVKLGLLGSFEKRGRKYYRLNSKSEKYQTVKSYVANASKYLKGYKNYRDELYAFLDKMHGLKLAVLTGVFAGRPEAECDVLLVGKLSRRQIENFDRGVQKLMGQEVNYAVLDPDEFEYRRNVFDRFTKDIFEHEHLIAVSRK